MNLEEVQARRLARARERQLRIRRRRRVAALLAVGVVAVIAVAVALASSGGGGPTKSTELALARHRATGHQPAATAASTLARPSPATPTGKPGTTPVPILMYHVINPPPAGAPFPGLYVPAHEFAAQMQALKAPDGTRSRSTSSRRTGPGVPLGPGKPIVLTFDNGYRSQYVNALPVLQQLHWVADENIQLTGLPPSQGGLTSDQIKGLVSAGWELDTQGISHADLVVLDPVRAAGAGRHARRTIQREYGVPVNWFCYPSGHYNAAVIAEVKAAGYKARRP